MLLEGTLTGQAYIKPEWRKEQRENDKMSTAFSSQSFLGAEEVKQNEIYKERTYRVE